MDGHKGGYPGVGEWRDTGMAIRTFGDGGTQEWLSGRWGMVGHRDGHPDVRGRLRNF